MNTQATKNEKSMKQNLKSNLSAEIYELIEKRNMDILKLLLEMKYLTADQIERKFFSFSTEKAKKYLASCLKKLTDLKLIVKKTYDKFEIYVPTAVAHQQLCEKADGKIVTKPTQRVFEPRLNHDLKLTELRFKLEEEKKLRKWYSENMLKEIPKLTQAFSDLPDALLTLSDGTSAFLELEISRKGNQKYTERIEEYKRILADEQIRSQKIQKVQFVCTDIKVYELLKGLLVQEKQFDVKLISEFGL